MPTFVLVGCREASVWGWYHHQRAEVLRLSQNEVQFLLLSSGLDT